MTKQVTQNQQRLGLERIEEALPLSSLPDVVGTIAFAVRPDAVGEGDEDEEAQQ